MSNLPSLEDYENHDEETIYMDGFDDALLGLGTQFNRDLAIYDYERCIEILMNRDDMTYEEAKEFMEFNVVGSYLGDHTPVFLTFFEDEQ